MAHLSRPRTLDTANLAPLEGWLARELDAGKVAISDASLLPGGAIGENWRFRAVVTGGKRVGNHGWVLRTDAASRMAMSHNRAEEFACIEVAYISEVRVPAPIAVQPDPSLIGAPFMIVGELSGTAQGRRIVRDPGLAGFGEALAEELGTELAKIHTILPPRPGLSFLPMPKRSPAGDAIAQMRASLDAISEPRPALEYILRWLDANAPDTRAMVLCHGDFRTGNYLVDSGRLTGILDWEFAHWGDRHEDIGWFCARCWRFGNDQLEAGGIATREAFYRGYDRAAHEPVDRAIVPYWETLAAARWAVIALLQGERHISGGEASLELLLTGMMAPEMERDALAAIDALERGS